MGTMFRCPFEVKGEQDASIITLTLPETQEARFELLRHTLERFHRNHRLSAIRLIVPESAWRGCESNGALKPRILPYQAEVVAAMLDDLFWPLLPHQDTGKETLEGLGLRLPFPVAHAALLKKFMGVAAPRTMAALSAYLTDVLGKGKAYELREHDAATDELIFVLLALGTVQIGNENQKNLFTLVKTPFYPPEFGRYSKRVEIVLTRHHDIDRLSDETKHRIRRQANEVYAAHGVPIDDIDRTQQNAGLWIPGEEDALIVVK